MPDMQHGCGHLQSHVRESCEQPSCCWCCDPFLARLTSPAWEHGVQHNLLSTLPGEASSELVWRRLLLCCALQSRQVLNIGIAAGRIEAKERTRGNKKTILVRYTVFYQFQSVFPTSPLKFCWKTNSLFFFSCWACDYKQKCKHVCGPLESHFLHSCIEWSSKHGKVFSEISFFINENYCRLQTASDCCRHSKSKCLNNGEKCQCQFLEATG